MVFKTRPVLEVVRDAEVSMLLPQSSLSVVAIRYSSSTAGTSSSINDARNEAISTDQKI